MWRRLAAVSFAVLGGCAGAEGATAIDVVVTEAEPLSVRLTEIELFVEELGGSATIQLRHERIAASYAGTRLTPWSTRITPRDASSAGGTLHRFRARGLRGDQAVVDVQSRVAFVVDQRLVLPLRFYRSCEGVACAIGADSTCREGRCEDDLVDPCTLSPRSSGCDAGATGRDGAMPPAPPAPPPPPPPMGCSTDTECDDVLPCTTTRCEGGLCRIDVAPGTCLIDGVCRASGERRVGDPCAACLADRSQRSWSIDASARCDDGRFCTRDDVCTAMGTCAGAAVVCPTGTACNDAAMACTCVASAETCNGLDDDCNMVVDDVPGGCTTIACTPGATRSLGNCGRCGTLFERCGADGRWSGSSSCEGEGECNAGDTDTLPGSCDGCGRRERTCSSSCRWGAERCAGGGACVPGQTEDRGSCGSCGVRRATCTASCSWGPESCVGGGACTPGETRWGASCGRCGAYEQTCSGACAWVENTSFCHGEGACFPGETRASGACDPCEEEVCTDVCTWGGVCRLRPGAECPWWGGANWRCCGASAWQFCLPDVCVWSTDCAPCSGCGC